jgi:hypothetical protein
MRSANVSLIGALNIELTDGTSFSYCVSQSPTVTASIYKGGSGSPEILKNYEF